MEDRRLAMETVRDRLARPELLIVCGVFPVALTQFLGAIGISLSPAIETGFLAVGFIGAALVSFSLGYVIGSNGWLLYTVAGPVLVALGMVTGPFSGSLFFGCLLVGPLLIVSDIFCTDEPTRRTQNAN